MKRRSILATLLLGLFAEALFHPAQAGTPTDVETPVGIFQRMTPEYWITEPAVNGEAAITWKQVRATEGLIELRETKSGGVLMFDLKNRIVAFVQKVSERRVKPTPGNRLAIFAAGGIFVEGAGKRWTERPDKGAVRIWDEVDRDEWSVYLESEQRGEAAQLDLYQASLTLTGGPACDTPCVRRLLTAGTAHPISKLTTE